ncbi:MAG: efflux RND transporter periplasmic adaptor subunit [Butyrivibrio sp.]|nr:efflux RND transporter periplasmic adaptor subunit [Butyrivibrio sp.]MBQ8030870.1 efflux RND transporter periplasmic adaptor subunit [Butyrivibrio sp.]MBR1640723.1 efflux RND transporter periplasmic adaptor subunit [Butyrivibrio sp.]MBR1643714.1 efflux RND transporter periplasmic adaptor subunit [Butyrivibrio sp.]
MEENKNLEEKVVDTAVDTKEAESKDTATANIATDQNVIKETTGASVEIYDEDDSIDLSDSTKKKKRKFKKRYILFGVLALGVIGFIIGRINASKNSIVTVETHEVALGSIENILSISGTVESAENKNYFTEVSAPLETVNVKVGDKVKAGDVLCTYDADALELQQKSAELAIQQAKGNYSALYSPVGAADRKYAEGMTAQQINDRIDAITAEIDSLNRQITEKTSRMNQTLTDLQKVARDINQNGISDSQEGYFESGNTNYIYRNTEDTKENGEYTEPTESNKQMALAVQDSISDVSYAIQNDPQIQAWNNQITALKEEQSHLSSAKASQINPGTASATKASMEATELTQEDTLGKIEAAKEGIKADFNGVITAMPATVVEGATVANGSQLFTIANLDDVQVSISVSKSDLPKVSVGEKVDITINGKQYQGEVTKVSGTATKNSNGVAVVATIIKVTNPDSDIILGVEANNKIHAQKADDTIVLPYELIQTDSTGDFVYVLENGVVTRKDVTIGISTSTDAQITEGLSVGDQVISSDVSLLTEGMAVVVAQ